LHQQQGRQRGHNRIKNEINNKVYEVPRTHYYLQSTGPRLGAIRPVQHYLQRIGNPDLSVLPAHPFDYQFKAAQGRDGR